MGQVYLVDCFRVASSSCGSNGRQRKIKSDHARRLYRGSDCLLEFVRWCGERVCARHVRCQLLAKKSLVTADDAGSLAKANIAIRIRVCRSASLGAPRG